MSQPSAIAIMSPKCTASAFVTGSVPGWPRQIGQVWTFGSSPKDSSQPQNIFVRVRSCTWISSPITGSQSAITNPPDLILVHAEVVAHLVPDGPANLLGVRVRGPEDDDPVQAP